MSETQMPTPRTRLVREADRAVYDREAVYRILDEGFICHVGFSVDGQPFVIPTSFGRQDANLYIHGSAASRMLRQMKEGVAVCVTVTLLDGLVLARSVFNHSMNYRSVVILATADELTDAAEKRAALEALVERIVPGRVTQVRAPSARELDATAVLSVPIEEASAKIRSGPPQDAEEDYALDCWAGVLPLQLSRGAPQPDPRLRAAVPAPVLPARGARDPGRA
jgi:hypothetical protein